MKTVALAAGLAQLLLGLMLLAPQLFGSVRTNFTWDVVLAVFPSIALAIFFGAVFFECDQVNGSIEMRVAALVAALCLSLENLPHIYGTIRGAISASQSGYGWRQHPFLQTRYVLAPTLPAASAILMIAFLILMYRTTPRFEKPDSGATREYGHRGLEGAALLVLAASLVLIGQLFSAVISTPFRHAGAFMFELALRIMSLVSLVVFFLLFWIAQRHQLMRSPG